MRNTRRRASSEDSDDSGAHNGHFAGKNLASKVSNNLVAGLPWDKVVAALISTLIIVVAFGRVFALSDSVRQQSVELERVRSVAVSDVAALRGELSRWEQTVDLLLKNLEDRLTKQLREELRAVSDRARAETQERFELDKRLSVLEIRHQIQPLERPVATKPHDQRTTVNESQLDVKVASELQKLRTQLDALMAQSVSSTVSEETQTPPVQAMQDVDVDVSVADVPAAV